MAGGETMNGHRRQNGHTGTYNTFTGVAYGTALMAYSQAPTWYLSRTHKNSPGTHVVLTGTQGHTTCARHRGRNLQPHAKRTGCPPVEVGGGHVGPEE